MIMVSGIIIPLGSDDDAAAQAACTKLGISRHEVLSYAMRKISYDARHGKVTMVCSVIFELKDHYLEDRLYETFEYVNKFKKGGLDPKIGTQKLDNRPIVVGFGPAGMLAAYVLSVYGYRPIVLERGQNVDERQNSVTRFFETGQLDTESNIQFGEGGAGTFSDGKLTTRINDELCNYVLDELVKLGAPADILYKSKPHIGSDKLKDVVKNLRGAIIEKGGEVVFNCRVDDIITSGGSFGGVLCKDHTYSAEAAIFACGHSARDTFLMLKDKPLNLVAKPFSVGVRIEHLQSDIDKALYGRYADDPRLPRGEYALSANVNGRSVYTFCMCPGGTVVAAASENGGIVTNGMSGYARDGVNANSALVASVSFGDPFEGIEYQRKLERAAYSAAQGGFKAPAQDVEGFLSGKPSLDIKSVEPSYPRGVVPYNIADILGDEISTCLREGIDKFCKLIKVFDDDDAVITGIETRTSSPLRIERDPDTREAVGMPGLYPCGEGAGYAGGIMSAAVDGIKSALAIIEKYKPMV